jgi:circadian clock protein KaiC
MGVKSVRKSGATASTKLKDARGPSGIKGLDDILAGGLPSEGFYLIQGDPGSGKTTLALQFLLEDNSGPRAPLGRIIAR